MQCGPMLDMAQWQVKNEEELLQIASFPVFGVSSRVTA